MTVTNRWYFDEERGIFNLWLADHAPFERKTYVYPDLDVMTFCMTSTSEGESYHPIFEITTVLEMLVHTGRDDEAAEFKPVAEWLEKQVWQDGFLGVVETLLDGPSIHPKLAWRLKRLAEWYVQSGGEPAKLSPRDFRDLYDGYGLHTRWHIDFNWQISPEAKST